MDSYLEGTFMITLFDNYYYSHEMTFTPLRMSPYSQWVLWYRPDSQSPMDWGMFDIDFYGSTDLIIGTIETDIVENAKTTSYSFYDWIKSHGKGDIFPTS